MGGLHVLHIHYTIIFRKISYNKFSFKRKYIEFLSQYYSSINYWSKLEILNEFNHSQNFL